MTDKNAPELVERSTRLDTIPVSVGAGAKIQSAGDAWLLAQVYHRAGMVPSGFKNVQQVMVALLAGSELGLPVTTSLKWIMSFGGMPVLFGDGPIGVSLRSGQVEWFDNGYTGDVGKDDRTAWFEIKRRGILKSARRTFSMAEAKAAGLTGKDNWKKFPDRMLFNRARAYAIRDLFSDCLGGLSIYEELEDVVEVQAEVKPVGSAGLLESLTGPAPEARAEIAEEHELEAEPSPTEPDSFDEPTPEEVEAIHRRELEEAGLFPEAQL